MTRKGYVRLTDTQTCETAAQAEPSDPPSMNGYVGAQGIKATPGITESWLLRVRIAGAVCYLDVDSAYPPGAPAGKGPAVRRLRCYVSWVS